MNRLSKLGVVGTFLWWSLPQPRTSPVAAVLAAEAPGLVGPAVVMRRVLRLLVMTRLRRRPQRRRHLLVLVRVLVLVAVVVVAVGGAVRQWRRLGSRPRRQWGRGGLVAGRQLRVARGGGAVGRRQPAVEWRVLGRVGLGRVVTRRRTLLKVYRRQGQEQSGARLELDLHRRWRRRGCWRRRGGERRRCQQCYGSR